jgi:photosystem II stability/assembly factor-like uncharacterized protein
VLKLRITVIAALAMPPAASAQWAYTTSGAGELRGLSAAGDSIIWASGTRGTVVRSTDGGRTWRVDSIPGAGTLDFRAIHAFNERGVFVASAGEAEKGLAQIFTTENAGRRWHRVFNTDRQGIFLDAIAFWNVRTGVALSDPVEGSFGVYITTDGGQEWTLLPAANLPKNLPGEAAFAASGSSIVLRGTSEIWIGTGGGGRARVMYSADRGNTWTVSDTPVHAEGSAAGIFSIAFFDSRRGIAVGGDYTKRVLAAPSVALTSDGGRTWRVAKAPPAAFLSGVAYAGSPAKLVAVGLAGTFVSADSGDTWAQVDSIPMNSVRFHGTSGWAAGPRGRVARWTP